ncbi:hypothetical protein [Nesterenkonia sp. Act20]|uniref:hypothetical protein n=1 Tax=Nesterenkonia sp. Act20 TaxID=1483432 RepID=UPI001C477FDA|nr:hypothetical protein [Nesterenkonia sp. Act20]
MPKRSITKPARIVIIATLLVVVSTLGTAARLFIGDAILESLFVLMAGTHLLVLVALWFTYRANTRVLHLSRRATQESKQIQGLATRIESLQEEIISLKVREEFLHDLTRKRIREKHNNLVLIARKNRDLHELTRKRLREKHNSLYRYLGAKVDKLEKNQRLSVDPALKQEKPNQNVTPIPNQDRSSLRNALFAILEQSNK